MLESVYHFIVFKNSMKHPVKFLRVKKKKKKSSVLFKLILIKLTSNHSTSMSLLSEIYNVVQYRIDEKKVSEKKKYINI